MVNLDELLEDLELEADLLAHRLEDLDPASWELTTPARGWTIRDQLAHLCFFDEAACEALADPLAFACRASAVQANAGAGPASRPDVAWARRMDPALLLARWQNARARLADQVRAAVAAGRTRVPWIGPEMGVASFVTARHMEVWAHGVDVRDTLGIDLAEVATDRLRHVCHLGYATRPFSLAIHGVTDADGPVRLEVTAPDGARWTWGPAEAEDVIIGSALDVALVVTQRRSLAHSGLVIQGRAAQRWLQVAQAFAGPPTLTDPER